MTFNMQKARSEKRVTEIYDHLYPAALDEIDEQSGQIATLKAALIDHVEQGKIAQMGRFGFVLDSTVCDPYGDARKQLAREYPEIFKEMKE